METKTNYFKSGTGGLVKNIKLFKNNLELANYQTAWIPSREWPPYPTYTEEKINKDESHEIIDIMINRNKNDTFEMSAAYYIKKNYFKNRRQCKCKYDKNFKLIDSEFEDGIECPKNMLQYVTYKSWFLEQLETKNTLCGDKKEREFIIDDDTVGYVLEDKAILVKTKDEVFLTEQYFDKSKTTLRFRYPYGEDFYHAYTIPSVEDYTKSNEDYLLNKYSKHDQNIFGEFKCKEWAYRVNNKN